MSPTPPAAIASLVAEQRRFFATGQTRGLSFREEALARLESALESREEEILAALAADLGKPPVEAFLAEFHFARAELRLMRKHLRRWARPRRAHTPFYFLPGTSRVRPEPHGVTLVMAPWNYPVQLALSPLFTAVAAGNTVILKPSEHAPASARVLASLVEEVFPAGHVATVQGDVETAQALLEQRFDFIFFTGSTAVGREVAQAAARHLTPHVLELGGKCPCVVDASADLAVSARRILIAKLFNAGQTCFAPDFVAVEESIHADFAAALAATLNEFPWEGELARIVNARHYERLEGLVSGEVMQKGEDDRARLFFTPRILPEASWDDPSMREEIFGPILPVVRYRDPAELVEKLRGLPTPLSLYCFSRRKEFIDHLLDCVPSGGACINDVGKQATNLSLPFGGSGASGHGRYRGRAGFLAFSQERAIVRRTFLPDPFELLPPRGKREKFLRRIFR